MASVRVARSGIHGRGVVAARALARGEVAFRIEGRLVAGDRVTSNGIQVWRDHYVEPRPPARFVNHACQPNAEVTRGLEVRARRAIAPGEEVTIDYCSVVLWEPWRMRCACGGPRCRGTVRAWGRTPPAVRRRYPLPLFAWVEEGRVPRGLRAGLAAGARDALTRRRGRGTPPSRRRARRGR